MSDIIKIRKSDGSFKEIILAQQQSIKLLKGDIIYIDEDMNDVQLNITAQNNIEITYPDGKSVQIDGLFDVSDNQELTAELLESVMNFKNELLELESLDTYDKLLEALDSNISLPTFDTNMIASASLDLTDDIEIISINEKVLEEKEIIRSDFFDDMDTRLSQFENNYFSLTSDLDEIESTLLISEELDKQYQDLQAPFDLSTATPEELAAYLSKLSEMRELNQKHLKISTEMFDKAQLSYQEAQILFERTSKDLHEFNAPHMNNKNPEDFRQLQEAHNKAQEMLKRSQDAFEKAKEQLDCANKNFDQLNQIESDVKEKIDELIASTQEEMNNLESEMNETHSLYEKNQLRYEKAELISSLKKDIFALLDESLKSNLNSSSKDEEVIKTYSTQAVDAAKVYVTSLQLQMTLLDENLAFIQLEQEKITLAHEMALNELERVTSSEKEFIQKHIEILEMQEKELNNQYQEIEEEKEVISQELKDAQKRLDETINQDLLLQDNEEIENYLPENYENSDEFVVEIESSLESEEINSEMILDIDGLILASTDVINNLEEINQNKIFIDESDYSLEEEILDSLENTIKDKPLENKNQNDINNKVLQEDDSLIYSQNSDEIIFENEITIDI